MSAAAALTGAGVVCATASTSELFVESLHNAHCGLGPIGAPQAAHFRASQAGLVRALNESAIRQRAGIVGPVDRFVLLALDACYQALAQAGLGNTLAGRKAAAVFSTCSGAMLSVEKEYASDPLWMHHNPFERWCASRYYSAAHTAAAVFGIDGPVLTITTACSASTNALGIARNLVALGKADIVLVCGADSFSLTTLAGFDGLKATCPERCAPFSNPVGMNLGEAGGAAVIESPESARARGVEPLGFIVGYGASNDAFHSTAPDPSGKGPAAAMQRALLNAGVQSSEIKYINAHGTGTEANDKTEVKAMRRVFGEALDTIAVSSIKGATGHCLGAAGIIEALASLLCARSGFYPPSINFSTLRESCQLDHVGTAPRNWCAPHLFMTNNLAFGGNNASLIMSPQEPAHSAKVFQSPDQVCIGAVGLVTPFGVGTDQFYHGVKACLEGKSFERIDTSNLDLRSIDRRLDVRGADTATRCGAAAASLALAQCAIGNRSSDRSDIGLICHCAHTQPWAEAGHIRPLLESAFHIDHLGAFPGVVPNAVNGAIARAQMLQGYNLTTCLGPRAGVLGLGLAADMISCGHASILLSGACDAPAQGDRIAGGWPFGETEDAAGIMIVLGTRQEFAQRGIAPIGTICGWQMQTTTAINEPQPLDTARLSNLARRVVNGCGVATGEKVTFCTPYTSEIAGQIARDSGVQLTAQPVDFKRIGKSFETCGGLIELIWSLLNEQIENGGSKNYILSLDHSPAGSMGALLIALEP